MSATGRIVTIHDVERMTPAERHEAFEAGVITDPTQIPAQLVAMRARLLARSESRRAEGQGD